MQGLHAVAYEGALGRPLVCPEDCTGGLNADMLASYVEQNFKANRIVFAGSGMEHQELVSLVEPLVGGVQASSQTEQPASKYIGGDFRFVFTSNDQGNVCISMKSIGLLFIWEALSAVCSICEAEVPRSPMKKGTR